MDESQAAVEPLSLGRRFAGRFQRKQNMFEIRQVFSGFGHEFIGTSFHRLLGLSCRSTANAVRFT
jgi:hypothetical protein